MYPAATSRNCAHGIPYSPITLFLFAAALHSPFLTSLSNGSQRAASNLGNYQTTLTHGKFFIRHWPACFAPCAVLQRAQFCDSHENAVVVRSLRRRPPLELCALHHANSRTRVPCRRVVVVFSPCCRRVVLSSCCRRVRSVWPPCFAPWEAKGLETQCLREMYDSRTDRDRDRERNRDKDRDRGKDRDRDRTRTMMMTTTMTTTRMRMTDNTFFFQD